MFGLQSVANASIINDTQRSFFYPNIIGIMQSMFGKIVSILSRLCLGLRSRQSLTLVMNHYAKWNLLLSFEIFFKLNIVPISFSLSPSPSPHIATDNPPLPSDDTNVPSLSTFVYFVNFSPFLTLVRTIVGHEFFSLKMWKTEVASCS